MERTEPALVPEWLRCTGNVTGGGASVHHSDVSSPARSMRSRSLRSNTEKESSRYLERSLSSHSRCSSTSNGSAKHPYSSFSRNHGDRNRDKGKDRPISEDIWEHDSSDPLANVLTSRVERSALKRSQSLVSRNTGDPFPRRVEDSRTSGNGVLLRGSNLNVIQKGVFEKDFPSLGTEDKLGVTGIRRVSSPGLSSAVQSLPIGSSGFLGGEKWTSALVEVPSILANNGTGQPPLQHNAVTSSNSSSGVSSVAGLNMAEALSQPASRVHTNPQLPDKSQRLEELAIKQSRQLIPVTPSMPKPLVPSSADKSKQPKISVRTSEMTAAPRAVHPQPHSSHLANQSRAGQTRSDSATTSHVGKFLVLKSGREGIITGAKDASSPTGDANCKVAKDGLLVATSSNSTASTSVSNSLVSALESKSAALSLSPRSTVDKKPSQSLAQSRSEFFNLMRRKNSARSPAIHSNSSLDALSPSAETSKDNFREGHAALSPCVLENNDQMICNGDSITENIRSLSDVGENSLSGHVSIYPDEEEAAFLRSLGWEENGGEDEGLTEEEINAFYQEYMNRRPSSLEVCQSSQPKCPTSKSPDAISGIVSSDSSSSESDAGA